jgi:hypothetical protein
MVGAEEEEVVGEEVEVEEVVVDVEEEEVVVEVDVEEVKYARQKLALNQGIN